MSILNRIIEDTRLLVGERKQRIPVDDLERSSHFRAPTLSLAYALRKPDLTVIAEIKKASPSKGLIRAEFPVQELALSYKHGGAHALSVLTEPKYFLGSPEYLKHVRRTVDLPLLRKDFMVDPYQVYEARAWGADAILLIAAVLDKALLFDLHQLADELGLSCLVEVHDPSELDKLDLDQVKVVGVNNRNLHDFSVDLDQSLRVFAQVPAPIVRVAESGLRTPQDLAYLRQNGVDAVLIGETFMRATQPGDALRKLLQDTQTLLESTILA